MTLYLLDTDSLIFLLRQNPGLQTKVQKVGVSSIALSVITVAEALYGAYNSTNIQNLPSTRQLIGQFSVIDLNQTIADRFGGIKAILRQSGQPMSNFDLLTGVTAIIEQRTLVTNNLKDFNRLMTFGLAIENWKS